MTALKREKEITPRLEAAARRDSKNVPLQYVLADRYRETGEIDKAEALYKELLTSQPTPQTYRALAGFALEAEEGRRPAQGDLRGLEATRKPGMEAVKPQLEAAAADDAMAEAMLDAGSSRLAANPPTSAAKSAYEVLSLIAN